MTRSLQYDTRLSVPFQPQFFLQLCRWVDLFCPTLWWAFSTLLWRFWFGVYFPHLKIVSTIIIIYLKYNFPGPLTLSTIMIIYLKYIIPASYLVTFPLLKLSLLWQFSNKDNMIVTVWAFSPFSYNLTKDSSETKFVGFFSALPAGEMN